MLDKVITSISNVFAAIPFSSATWFVIGILSFFTWLFMRAHKNPNSPVAWEDLIINHETERTSPYKLGYLIGVIVGTWIVVTFADGGKLSFDIFGLYLSFLLGGAGWAAFMQMKSNNNTSQSGGYYNRPNYQPSQYNQNGNGNNSNGGNTPPNTPKLDEHDDELDVALPPNLKGR